MLDKVNQLAKEFKPQMEALAQALIKLPSEPGHEKEVSEICIKEMEKLGFDEIFRDQWGNVVGIIKGDTPGPVIMYNSHMDTVDVGDLTKWEGFDPHGATRTMYQAANQDNTAEEATEVIIGRGACDMKSSIAAHIYGGAILKELKKRFGYKQRGDYLLATVVMEEYGDMIGTIKLVEETLPARNIKISAGVFGEPSSLMLALGHRGRMELQVEVLGKSIHTGMAQFGVNAVSKAGKFIVEYEKLVKEENKYDPDLGNSGLALTIITCFPGNLATVPGLCTIIYDRRITPEESPAYCVDQAQRVIDQLAKQDPDFSAKVTVRAETHTTYTGIDVRIPNQKGALKLDVKHPVTMACAAGLAGVGQDVKYKYWGFSTDMPATQVNLGIPSLGYSGLQECYAHLPIERVRLDYLEKGLAGGVGMYLKLSELEAKDFVL